MTVRLQNKDNFQIIKIDQIESIHVIGLKVEIIWKVKKQFQRLEINLNDYRMKIDK